MLSGGIRYPFDIFAVCNLFSKLQISTIPFLTPGLRGLAVPADAPGSVSCILLNSTLSYPEQNFQGFHELIHIYESKSCPGITFRCYDKIKPDQDSYTEWVANEGAAELLMPYTVFIPYFIELFDVYVNDSLTWNYTYGNADIYDVMANQFGVTNVIIRNRVSTLSYEIDRYLNGETINEIIPISHNKQLKLGIQTTDYVYLISIASAKYIFGLEWDSVIM